MPRKAVIHIVDDDVGVRTSTALFLRSLGWSAHDHASAEAFLECHDRDDAADCLIIDLHLPGMNGLALYEALKIRGCRCPVILITADETHPLAVEAKQVGAMGVFFKPFRQTVLRPLIECALQQTD